MVAHNNKSTVIEEAERELTTLNEKLKEYDEIRLQIANLEAFIKAGRAVIGITKPSAGIDEGYASPELFPKKAGRDELIEKPHIEGIKEILGETKGPMSLRELADEFHERKWKLSKENGRQVLRSAIGRYLDDFNTTMQGITTYYELKS